MIVGAVEGPAEMHREDSGTVLIAEIGGDGPLDRFQVRLHTEGADMDWLEAELRGKTVRVTVEVVD